MNAQGTAHQVAEGVPEVAETASRQVEQLAGNLEKELPKVWLGLNTSVHLIADIV